MIAVPTPKRIASTVMIPMTVIIIITRLGFRRTVEDTTGPRRGGKFLSGYKLQPGSVRYLEIRIQG